MTQFSDYVYAMGRGPSKGRNLTKEEAQDALTQILNGQVEKEAIGALFMLMRYRGETADEIAGFSTAMLNRLQHWKTLNVDINWPSYAAGRTRGHPWFLLSAKLLASAGYKVLIHGWNAHQNMISDVRIGAKELGIDIVSSANEAKTALDRHSIAFAPLSSLDGKIKDLLLLRKALGLRSPLNTACRALNPANGKLNVVGVFHPSYREIQLQTVKQLGNQDICVIKGGGGEFELNPSKDTEIYQLIAENEVGYTYPAQTQAPRKLSSATEESSGLLDLLEKKDRNTFAKQIVINTAAVAFRGLNPSIGVQEAKETMLNQFDTI